MALVLGEALMSASQAKKLMEITTRYTRDSATALGPDLAYAIARHVARTKTHDNVEDIVRRGFPVDGRRKSVYEVSVREVQRATQAAVMKQKGRHGDSARAKRDAEGTAAQIRGELAKRGFDAPDVRLEFAGGQWVLAARVPASRAEMLFR